MNQEEIREKIMADVIRERDEGYEEDEMRSDGTSLCMTTLNINK